MHPTSSSVGAEFESYPQQNGPDGAMSSKQDVKSVAISKMKPNATIHVSNTTMIELLSKDFTKMAKSTNKITRKVIKEHSSELEVARVFRSLFDNIKAQDKSMGDLESVIKDAPDDLVTAAGHKSKKYILVKKKPKDKKIKMEILEPKYKYKTIKLKIPVKKYKKKKIKGYLIKKEKHHHHR